MIDLSNLMVVAYHTPGPYDGEAARLQTSLQRLDIPYQIDRCFNCGDMSWTEVVKRKPFMLMDWVVNNPDRPLLYVDVDAVFHRDPRKVIQPDSWQPETMAPLTIHRMGRNWLSGTILIMPGQPTLDMLCIWMDMADEHANLRQPQQALQYVPDLGTDLPAEWCWIFDISSRHFGDKSNTMVIEHLQASREFRDDKPKRTTQERRTNRTARIAQLEEQLYA